jgi:hypothetical protein
VTSHSVQHAVDDVVRALGSYVTVQQTTDAYVGVPVGHVGN